MPRVWASAGVRVKTIDVTVQAVAVYSSHRQLRSLSLFSLDVPVAACNAGTQRYMYSTAEIRFEIARSSISCVTQCVHCRGSRPVEIKVRPG